MNLHENSTDNTVMFQLLLSSTYRVMGFVAVSPTVLLWGKLGVHKKLGENTTS